MIENVHNLKSFQGIEFNKEYICSNGHMHIYSIFQYSSGIKIEYSVYGLHDDPYYNREDGKRKWEGWDIKDWYRIDDTLELLEMHNKFKKLKLIPDNKGKEYDIVSGN